MHSVLFFSWCWLDCWYCSVCVFAFFRFLQTSLQHSERGCLLACQRCLSAWACVCRVMQVFGWICLCECHCIRVYPDARWGCKELDRLPCRSCCSAAVCVRRPVTHSEHPWTWMWLHASLCCPAVSTNTFVLKSVGFWRVHHVSLKWFKIFIIVS